MCCVELARRVVRLRCDWRWMHPADPGSSLAPFKKVFKSAAESSSDATKEGRHRGS